MFVLKKANEVSCWNLVYKRLQQWSLVDLEEEGISGMTIHNLLNLRKHPVKMNYGVPTATSQATLMRTVFSCMARRKFWHGLEVSKAKHTIRLMWPIRKATN